MADKEERILVLTTHNKDGECECVMQDGCHANDSCAICNVGMTRQEAINRMTKTMCADDFLVEGYYAMAEAALNSLLEEHK